MPKKYQVLESKVIVDDFIKVKKDKLELPNGKTTENLSVLTPDSVSIVVYRDNKITLVNEYRHSLKEFRWQLPSGYINEGETPEEAAIRECQEEIGLKPLKLELLTKSAIWEGVASTIHSIYFASEFEENKLPQDENEFLTVREFSLTEIKFMTLRGRNSLTFISAILLAKEKGFIVF